MKKDNKGRNLKQNEDQMKDGRYRYRYIDTYGNRKAVYSWRLVTTDKIPQGKRDDICLREKEIQIQRDLDDKIDSYTSQNTVYELMYMYFNIKVSLANSTKENYIHMCEKHIKNNKLGKMKICDVKKSDILRFYAYLYNEVGMAVGTIQLYQNILFPAFQMAVDDNIIRINPCRNCMKDYVRGSVSSTRTALTQEEQNSLLRFLKEDTSYYSEYLPMIVLMLGTGIRIGETIGLTWDNIDFENNQIIIDHQLIYKKKNGKCQHYASPTKNKKTRIIPMQKNVATIMKDYKTKKYFLSTSSGVVVDGYSNFVFINSNCKPYKPASITRSFHGIRDEYNRLENENAIEESREPDLLPDFTPHVLRHTFCTRMAENGMDVKVLQELMGHSNITVTMQVYNHVDKKRMESEFERIPDIVSI